MKVKTVYGQQGEVVIDESPLGIGLICVRFFDGAECDELDPNYPIYHRFLHFDELSLSQDDIKTLSNQRLSAYINHKINLLTKAHKKLTRRMDRCSDNDELYILSAYRTGLHQVLMNEREALNNLDSHEGSES